MAPDEQPDKPADAKRAAAGADRRKAARIATFVAIPVTLLALFGAVSFMGSLASAEEKQDKSRESSDEPVEVAVPDLSDEDFKVCRALITRLPDPLGELPRRVVAGDNGAPEIAGAWGEPAVKLRCGVEPVEVPKDGTVFRQKKTCWFAEESKQSTTWTTVDRRLAVELTVPAKYAQSQLTQPLDKPVDEKVPAVKNSPSGCAR